MTENGSKLDERLRTDIRAALAQHELTNGLELRVGVLNGIAHLAGNAPTNRVRKLAEQIVASVDGIRGVVNRIQAPGAPSPSRTIHLHLPDAEDASITRNRGGVNYADK